jgi:chemotaxis signal transduction protein
MQALVVEVQNQKIAFDVKYAHAVAKVDLPMVVVPHTEEKILGVVNFRGKVLPVFNLNNALGLSADFRYGYLLVLEKEAVLAGVLSEKIPKIEEVDEPGLFSIDRVFIQ